MNLNTNLWDSAENSFKLGLSNSESDNSEMDEIFHSIIFHFRKKHRERIHLLCNAVFEEIKNFDLPTENSLDNQLIAFDSEVLFGICRESVSEWPEEYGGNIKLEGFVQGDKQIFINLYENTYPKVEKYIIRNSGSSENAKDIFQDAIIILLEKCLYSNFNLTCSIETYLFSISKNLWFSQLRNNKKNLIVIEKNDFEILDDFVSVSNENQPDIYEEVRQSIERLGSRSQKLIEYYYYEKLSWNEIAKKLGYASSGSARNQKYKCLERIRKQIE